MKASLPLLVSMFCASVALAEPPPVPPAAAGSSVVELVNKQLLVPLKKAESKRSRFSRAAPVPVQRRVRVLDAVALADVHGKTFVRFAVDARRSWDERGPWKEGSIVGCAYPNERQVFVRQGASYLPARSMLGHDEQERPDACRPAEPRFAKGS